MNVSAMILTPAPFVHPTRWCTQANFLKGWPAEKPCVVPLLFFRKVAFEMPQCIAAMSPVSISTPPYGGRLPVFGCLLRVSLPEGGLAAAILAAVVYS